MATGETAPTETGTVAAPGGEGATGEAVTGEGGAQESAVS